MRIGFNTKSDEQRYLVLDHCHMCQLLNGGEFNNGLYKEVTMNTQNGYTIVEVMLILVIIFGIIGYVMNIVKFTRCDFESPYKCELIRGIGIIPPIGAVTGYVTIKDDKHESQD